MKVLRLDSYQDSIDEYLSKNIISCKHTWQYIISDAHVLLWELNWPKSVWINEIPYPRSWNIVNLSSPIAVDWVS